MPSKAKDFMEQLFAISKGMPGEQGKRIRTMVQVIMKAGYPRCLDLWYYSFYPLRAYLDVDLSLNTSSWKRIQMTMATNGAMPFDGDSGVYSQGGTLEQASGKWRIHIVQTLFDRFGACGRWDVGDMERFLRAIDDDMWRGWDLLQQASGRLQNQDGAGAWKDVLEFVLFVKRQAQDDKDLYSAFAP
jgi:hypothetical protein